MSRKGALATPGGSGRTAGRPGPRRQRGFGVSGKVVVFWEMSSRVGPVPPVGSGLTVSRVQKGSSSCQKFVGTESLNTIRKRVKDVIPLPTKTSKKKSKHERINLLLKD